MITPIMRISYPHLFVAKPNPSGTMKYSCSLMLPKSDKEGLKTLQKAVEAAILKGLNSIWAGKKPRFNYPPLRDGDEELKEGIKEGKAYKGMVFFNCSANIAPGVVDQDNQLIIREDKIYAGCWVRADVNPFPYAQSGNNGIGWGLNHVKLIREDDRLDGRSNPEDAFAGY